MSSLTSPVLLSLLLLPAALLLPVALQAQATTSPPRSLPQIDVEALKEAGPKALPELAQMMWRSPELTAKGRSVLEAWAAMALRDSELVAQWGEPKKLPSHAAIRVIWGNVRMPGFMLLSCRPAGSRVELYQIRFLGDRERGSAPWPRYAGEARVQRTYLSRPEYRTLIEYVSIIQSGKLVDPHATPGRELPGIGSKGRSYLMQVGVETDEQLYASGRYVGWIPYVGHMGSREFASFCWLEATRKVLKELLKRKGAKQIDVDVQVRAQFDGIASLVRRDLNAESGVSWFHELALHAAGKFGTKRSVPVLLQVLRRGDGAVRDRSSYYALRSLLELTGIELGAEELREVKLPDAVDEALRKYEQQQSQTERK